MTDEFEIRQLARDLKRLYEGMDEAKHEKPKPREIRTMKPSPGPSEPGNWLWISRCVTMEQNLREVALNAFADIQVKLRADDMVVGNLLDRISFNAAAIAELEWADDFHQELDDQARQMGKWLNPPDTKQVAQRPERYVGIDTIVRNLNQRGHKVTPRQAREVAVYQKFDIGKFTNGSNGYKLTEFINHYTKRTGA